MMRMIAINFRPILLAAALAVIYPLPAAAVETLDNVAATVHYDFSWGGVRFGKISLEADETDATYSIRTLIKSQGLAAIFVKHSSDSKASGTRSGTAYLPQTYDTNFATRNKKKHVLLNYDGAGNIKEEIMEPADTDRPKVSEADRNGARDPLSLLLEIRHKLYDALANSEKTFKVKMYDGRRLTQVQVDIVDLVEKEVAGEKKKLVHVITTRSPLSGYTDKELDRMKDGPNSMNVYFSDDSQLWPMLMEVDVYLATLRGEFTKACSDIEACF